MTLRNSRSFPQTTTTACVCQISDFTDSKKVSCHWFSFILLLNRPSAVPKSWNQVSWHCTTFSARKRRWGNASLIPPTTDPHGSVHRMSPNLLTNGILGPLWEKPLTALTNQCRFHCGEDTLHDTVVTGFPHLVERLRCKCLKFLGTKPRGGTQESACFQGLSRGTVIHMFGFPWRDDHTAFIPSNLTLAPNLQ